MYLPSITWVGVVKACLNFYKHDDYLPENYNYMQPTINFALYPTIPNYMTTHTNTYHYRANKYIPQQKINICHDLLIQKKKKILKNF